MAVTREVYSASPAWTASQAATLFENAFTDAGLMTAWYDSFLSGSVENRILEVTYDAAKTYGTTYYWFMFTTTGIAVSVASAWNATTHVPSGTQYLDYYATTTNSTTNHSIFSGTLSASTELQLVRYTSAITTDQSWFVLRNSATPVAFYIAPSTVELAPWLDLDKIFFHHFVTSDQWVISTTSNGRGSIAFASHMIMRRSYCGGGILYNSTSSTGYKYTIPLSVYFGGGHASNSASVNYAVSDFQQGGLFRATATIAPYGFADTNTAYASDYLPIMYGYTLSPYMRTDMPSDMAIHFQYTTTQFAFGDRVVVSAGVEEWEVLGFANTSVSQTPSPLLLARVV